MGAGRTRERVSEKRAQFTPAGGSRLGEPLGSRPAITAAPNAASTLAQSSSAPATGPSGLGAYVGAANAQQYQLLTSAPAAAARSPRTPRRLEPSLSL